ncbi:P-loop containing nucleoside triphosphate hydrolase protein [Mycena epipterygia]|nr:P-loop containing nucleoside triphosphate hydrolase protein [Mycena epipterygia]
MDRWTIVLLGDGGVGKTATLLTPVQEYDPTVEDSYHKQWIVDNDPCFIDVCDVAAENFYLSPRVNRKGQRYFLVYSLTSRASFNQLQTFWESVRRVPEEGIALTSRFGCRFLEISVRTGQNVDRAFADLVRLMRPDRAGAVDSQGSSGRKEKIKKKCVVL